MLRQFKTTINGKESISEERAAAFDFNNVSSEFVPVETIVKRDGVDSEKRTLLGIDRRSGVARFQVESLVTGQIVIESLDASGNLAEVFNPLSHEIVRYRTDFESEVYRLDRGCSHERSDDPSQRGAEGHDADDDDGRASLGALFRLDDREG